jgi:hypothetical protein
MINFGPNTPQPYENVVLGGVALALLVLLAGAITARHWAPGFARTVRWICVALGMGGPLIWHFAYPIRGGMEGVARLLVFVPAALIQIAFLAMWIWRAKGHA